MNTPPPSTGSPHRYQSFDDLFESPTRPHKHKRSLLGSPRLFGSRHDPNERDGDGDGDDVRSQPRPGRDGPNGTRTSRRRDNVKSSLSLFNLTLGLGGAQLAWTVEMAYGTPYLLELGISKQGTSLVWMAGPLSGLLIQPLVGALSDASTSKYRRRFYVALSALLIIVSTLVVAFAKEIASLVCSLGGIGDWDPERQGSEQTVAIWIGVVGFYVLDFSLNGLQAAMRALVLDVVPSHQQNQVNAWLGRQSHLANICGYLCGYFDLGSVPALKWIGGGQFRRLGVIGCLVMALTVAVTCSTQQEEKRDSDRDAVTASGSALERVYRDIRDNIKNLPLEVRRVCYVQFFAWTSWFPFLFYGTTYVAECLYASIPEGDPLPSADEATRAGSLALLLYAIVSIATGTFLPYLTTLGDRPFARKLSFTTTFGRTTRWVLSLITPRNCWTFALCCYTVGTVGTFFVAGPKGAMAFVAFQGISWAVTCWVPFALVMEYIREDEIPSSASPRSQASTPTSRTPPTTPHSPASPSSSPYSRPAPFRASNRQQSFVDPYAPASPSSPRFSATTEQSPLLASSTAAARRQRERHASERSSVGIGIGRDSTRRNQIEDDTDDAAGGHQRRSNSSRSTPRGGTVLGIHNLAIVAPQFVVAIVSAVILKLASTSAAKHSSLWATTVITGGQERGGGGGGGDELRGSNDVVWVLRFGGLAAIGGAILSRWVIPPGTEKEYVARVLYGKGDFGLDEGGDMDADDDDDEERGRD